MTTAFSYGMHRFHLPPARCQEPTLTLDGAEAHHALQVLRVTVGEPVVVLDGAGRELRCAVTAIQRRVLALEILAVRRHDPLPCRLVLCQAVTKTRSMEWIVQKATELGAARVLPILAERSVPQFEGDQGGRKTQKWREIAIESIKQCGSPWLPQIDEPVRLARGLAASGASELTLLGSLQPGARHPRSILELFRSGQSHNPREVAVWIGPEGDFTPAELEAIQTAGGKPITLGPSVLRAETAAVYCLAVLSYELQAGAPGAVIQAA